MYPDVKKSGSDILLFEADLRTAGEYIFGEEKCPSTGRLHLQGYINFKTKCRPLERFEIYGAHWEKCKGTLQQNWVYCTKDGKVHTNSKFKPLRDPYHENRAKTWQRDILRICDTEPDDRKIYWYWEKTGCTGKTTLAKHICMTKSAILVNGKNADVKFAITKWMTSGKYLDVVIFNFTRTNEDYVSYQSLEDVKDGIFFSSKFESEMVMFNPPHIFCFANFKPEIPALSKDRWVICEIDDTKNVQEVSERHVSFEEDSL